MIPRIVHQIWFGGEIPEKYKVWSRTIKVHNPDWSHIIWNLGMLESAGIATANHSSDYPTFCGLSDRIRPEVLLRFGGIYLDMDVECLKPLDPLIDAKAFASVQDVVDGKPRLCAAVFGAVPGCKFISDLISVYGDYKGHHPPWSTYAMSRLYGHPDLTVVPTHLIYPFYFDCPIDQRKPHGDSIVVHHWEKNW